jgi:hypothetical protein
MPEILTAYVGRMDRYLELNGFGPEESKDIILVALAGLQAGGVQPADIADLDLALFECLRSVCEERRTGS